MRLGKCNPKSEITHIQPQAGGEPRKYTPAIGGHVSAGAVIVSYTYVEIVGRTKIACKYQMPEQIGSELVL